MLEKLAAIADFADQNGEYAIASDATKLIKEAQLWDALRTLFDPEHTPGVDRNSKWLDRLSKGWNRGKMDRNLGLVLSIMSERTKLNQKIEKLVAPIKGFQDEVASFYDKLRDGRINSNNIREESRVLQSALKDSLKLVSGKDLKQILKLRERLEHQQIIAAEKIKGLDEETKNNLIAVLKGESLPPSGSPVADPKSPTGQIDAMKRWLKTKPIQKLPMHEGATTVPGQFAFRKFMRDYGFNPKAISDFFMTNGEAQGEAFERYPDAFSEMLRHAQQLLIYDDEMRRGVHRSQAKGKGKRSTETSVPGESKKEETQEAAEEEAEEVAETGKPPKKTDEEIAAELEAKTKADAEQAEARQKEDAETAAREAAAAANLKAERERMAEERKVREEKLQQAIEHQRKSRSGGSKKKKEQPAVPPGQSAPAPIAMRADDVPLAASAAQRVERQITRLARQRQLNKLAIWFDDDK